LLIYPICAIIYTCNINLSTETLRGLILLRHMAQASLSYIMGRMSYVCLSRTIAVLITRQVARRRLTSSDSRAHLYRCFGVRKISSDESNSVSTVPDTHLWRCSHTSFVELHYHIWLYYLTDDTTAVGTDCSILRCSCVEGEKAKLSFATRCRGR
jgi:hypothetical protein